MTDREPPINPEVLAWADGVKSHLSRAGYRFRAWDISDIGVEAVLQVGDDICGAFLLPDSNTAVHPVLIKEWSGLGWVDTVEPHSQRVPRAIMYCADLFSLGGYSGSQKELTATYLHDARRMRVAYQIINPTL